MAIETGRITINETAIIELDSSPLTGGGFDSPVGTLSVDKTTGILYRKQNTSPTGWEIMSRGNVRAVGEVQTTSPNDVLLQGMTITPTAGTYLVWAYTNSNNSSNGATNRFSVYSGGVQQADTLDNILVQNNRHFTWCASCEVTVNGIQAIEIRWNRSSGTARCFGRYITIVRVA